MKKKLLLLVLGLIATNQMIYSQVPTYVPSNGLVGYWPFNGNANDLSGNGLNGSPNNMIYDSDRNGNINSSLNINGNTNRWIDVAISNQILVNQQSKTFSMWVKLPVNYTGISYYNHIITMANLPWMQILGNNPTYISGGNINKFAFNGQLPVSNQQLNDNLWHNIIVVCDDTFNMKLYLDGLLVGNQSFPSTNNFTNLNQIRIGNNLGNLSQCAFAGQIDDVGIWNRALSQSEITTMYNGVNYSDSCNAVSGSLVNDLVGYWPFCGNANDQSGNNHNGTINGATLTKDRFEKSNSAYDFDGIDDFIEIPVKQQDITSYTISCWFKYPTNPISGDYKAMVQASGAHPNAKYSLSLQMSANPTSPAYNKASVSINGPGVFNGWISNSTYNDNLWHNLVGVLNVPSGVQTNSSYIQMYLDGVLINTLNSTSVNYSSVSTPINGYGNTFFGMMNHVIGSRYYQGQLDDIGIWNRALTSQEISQLYNQNQCMTNTTVTDTMIINVGQLSYTNPVTYANNITIYPNPANTQVNISFNNITDLTGGHIKIVNSLGQQVATTPITLSGTNTTLGLNTWGGTGLYFVQIVNAQGQIVDIKKIILQ